MKKTWFTSLLAILLGLAALYATAQVPQSEAHAEADAPRPKTPLKIMVLPFHPVNYYFSDCDKNVSARSKRKVQDIPNMYRAAMDYASEEKLEKKYEPINLLQLKDSVSKELLNAYYKNVSYTQDNPVGNLPKKQSKELKKLRESLSEATGKPADAGKKEEGADEECYTTLEKEGGQYMKATINPEFMEKLNEAYHADLYVTINQFEVKTDYEKCIDRDLGKFTRRIKVHYNVLTPQGKVVFGEVVTARYASNTDDVDKIIQDNFGFLGEYILKSIP